VFHAGWATFYDPVTPYQGRSTTGGFDGLFFKASYLHRF
jgi:hypothetical protein